jgi:hypothetical protein
MALIKSIDTEFGIPATYWNIGAVAEDFKGRGTEITFYGYASQEARFTNKQPLSAGKFQLTGSEYVAGADRQALYQIIKQRAEFVDALDALEPTPEQEPDPLLTQPEFAEPIPTEFAEPIPVEFAESAPEPEPEPTEPDAEPTEPEL